MFYTGSLIDADQPNESNGFFNAIEIEPFEKVMFYVFKYARIELLGLMSVEDNRLINDMLTFYEIKNPKNFSINLNTSFKTIRFYHVYRTSIGQKLLHPLVFGSAKKLEILGSILSIDDEIFRSFQCFGKLEINTDNLRDFIHASNNKWMESLNYDE